MIVPSAPENVQVSETQEKTVRLIWDSKPCTGQTNLPHVAEYEVSYCLIQTDSQAYCDNGNYAGMPFHSTLDSDTGAV